MCFYNSLIALLPTQIDSFVLSELSCIALQLDSNKKRIKIKKAQFASEE
jgi:hypothetical protein